jgi:branched-chain amino acid transport system permease protein
VAGALLVTALPQLLDHYSGSLPLVGAPGSDGLQPADASRFIYGAAVIAVLIFAPGGLSGLGRRIAGRLPFTSRSIGPEQKESTA